MQIRDPIERVSKWIIHTGLPRKRIKMLRDIYTGVILSVYLAKDNVMTMSHKMKHFQICMFNKYGKVYMFDTGEDILLH